MHEQVVHLTPPTLVLVVATRFGRLDGLTLTMDSQTGGVRKELLRQKMLFLSQVSWLWGWDSCTLNSINGIAQQTSVEECLECFKTFHEGHYL